MNGLSLNLPNLKWCPFWSFNAHQKPIDMLKEVPMLIYIFD